MRVKFSIWCQVNEAFAHVEPTRESFNEWYDWLAVLRDEETFKVDGAGNAAFIDWALGRFVLMIVEASVS